MKKVLALHNGKNDGVMWYRFRQFARKCKELDLLDVQCLPLYENEEKIAEIIKAADAYFALYGWAVEMPFLINLIRQRKNKPLIVDVDDKFDEVAPYSDAYKTYGMREVGTAYNRGKFSKTCICNYIIFYVAINIWPGGRLRTRL